MANYTLSVLDNVLKEVYEPAIEKALVSEISAFSRFQMNASQYAEKKHLIDIKTGRNEGVGPAAEEGALPTAMTPTWIQGYVQPKYHYGRLSITGQARAIAQGGQGSLVNALQESINDLIESFKVDMNRVFWADGTGKLCQINGAVSSGHTLTVDGISSGGTCYTGRNNVGTRYIQPGMYVNFYAGSSLEAGTGEVGRYVKSITSQTVFVLEDNGFSQISGIGDDDWVYRPNAYNAEMMGLLGIVDDGNTVATFQNWTRATTDQACALVLSNSSTARALTETLLMQAVSHPYERANGNIDMILMHPSVFRKYAEDLISADRMFVVGPTDTPKYQGGYARDGIYFAGVPIIQDRDCWYSKVFCLDSSTIKYLYAGDKPFGWIDEDGTIFKHVAGYDYTEAYLRMYGNMACVNPMKNSRIDDVEFDIPSYVFHR
jgi:hypothetical protein